MVKVLTYGTYDMLHYGHICLLERAKALGDYLIVGVTSDDFDKARGKINVQQSLTERIEAIRATGLVDQVIIEEYEGQKIDDIRRYGVDIFTVGSDWEGKFDYLKEYCKVVYLERTQGISSSDLRTMARKVRIGFFGDEETRILNKYCMECKYVNGAQVSGICSSNETIGIEQTGEIPFFTKNYEELLESSDAVYIISHPRLHYEHIKKALLAGKHVLVESPIALNGEQCAELFQIAKEQNVILMEAIKTAYATAYHRMLLLIKSGCIGKVVSIDAVCTSLREINVKEEGYFNIWNSICAWGPTAMLPIFQILGTTYKSKNIISYYLDKENQFDLFTKIDFLYEDAVASLRVGRGVKSEGNLIISGTKGYLYVPAPWWKTDYFEIRYEQQENNKRYFYQLDGEGIRYELVAFIKSINTGKLNTYISEEVSGAIASVLKDYYNDQIKEIR